MNVPDAADCLKCPLFKCSLDNDKPCKFVEITVDEHLRNEQDKRRRQKREHNARVRAKRRIEAEALQEDVRLLINAYILHGKHSLLVRTLRIAVNESKKKAADAVTPAAN